jgi:ribosomal protein S18 acetylase RimI-like enzyme
MNVLHRSAVPPRHLYLATLGVDPPHQGRGVGAALLRSGLARADVQGLPCYLETMLERNLDFYRRFGFEVAGEAVVPAGGPRFWGMARSPAVLELPTRDPGATP